MNEMPARRRRIAIPAVLNILAIPLYASITASILDHLDVPWSWREPLGIAGGAIVAIVLVALWRRSPVLAGLSQLAVFLPIVVLGAADGSFTWSAFEKASFTDWRVLVGIGVAVVIPAILIAMSIITIRRAREENTR